MRYFRKKKCLDLGIKVVYCDAFDTNALNFTQYQKQNHF